MIQSILHPAEGWPFVYQVVCLTIALTILFGPWVKKQVSAWL